MTRVAWRIAADTRDYPADDLSGAGAKLIPGRWNGAGAPLVYASTSRSLACLETLVHLDLSGLPLNRYLVQIDIPNDVWSRADRLDVSDLNVGWDAEPPGLVSVAIGTRWLRSRRSALLLVPSAIVPEELNVLIASDHVDASAISAHKVRKWLYDPRLSR